MLRCSASAIALSSASLVPEPIEKCAGFRYVDVNLDIRLDPGPDTRGNKDWVDPIVGLRATFHPLDKWTIRVRGDVGGFGLASDYFP